VPLAVVPLLTRTLLLAPLALAALPAQGQGSTACVRGTGEPRAYLDCLSREQRASEQHVTHTVAAAREAIEARAELQPAQRRRWIGLLEEAQSRFVSWRDFECQSIAPYEGGGQKTIGGRLGGVGVLEQRMGCLIELNQTRAADIERRYALPAYVPAPEPEPAAATAAATEATATPATGPGSTPAAPPPGGPVRVIDLPVQPR
jgi:uncharacterized protein YecT (DUF1311 family)